MTHSAVVLPKPKWCLAGTALVITMVAACNPDTPAGSSTVLSVGELTALRDDSLEGLYVDVASLGGSVAYLSTTEPFITLVDQAGRVTRQFGSPGEGPGEFRHPTSIDAQVDTLYVWDVRQGAASMYDTLGRYLGQRRAGANFGGVQRHARTNHPGRPGLYRRFGPLAVTAAYPNGVALPGEQRSYSLLALNDSGNVQDTAWTSTLPPSANQPAPKKQMMLVPIPVWARCSDVRLAVYDPEAGSVSLRNPQGVEVERLDAKAQVAPILKQDLIRFVGLNYRRLLREANQPLPDSFEDEMASMVDQFQAMDGLPSDYLGYTGILCDDRDQIWLNEFSMEDSPLGYSRTWTILSNGSEQRSVTLPAGFRLMLLSRGRGYGVVSDSTTAEYPAWIELLH